MTDPALLSATAGAIGLLAGSIVVFAAPRLVQYRLPEQIPHPSPVVLVPLIGLALERWRLRSSAAIEIITALLFAALAKHYGAGWPLVLSCTYTALFVAIAYIDLDHRLVLNRLSYPAAVLAVPAAILWPNFGWQSALLGAGAAGAIFVVLQILGRGALGTGDTKLAVLIGACRGFPMVFNALLLGMLLGGAAAVWMLLVMRRGRKHYIAYAPYLAAGAVLSYFLTL